MVRYKFNPEHHHDKGTGLFTMRGAHDETIWEKLTDQTTNIDCVVVRVMHGDKIAYYTDADAYMNAWFGEGYFHSAEMGQVEAVRNELIPFARKIGYDIPSRWLEGYAEPKQSTDIHIPWTFAVSLFRPHITHALIKRGKSPKEVQELINAAMKSEPAPETVKLVKLLVDQATAEHLRKLNEPNTPPGLGLVRKEVCGQPAPTKKPK